jgi:cyclase
MNQLGSDRLSRRSLLQAGAVAFGSALLAPVVAQSQQASASITTTDLGGLWLLQGAGCNVLALPGSDGALMIDGGLAANADALLRAVYAATGNDRVQMLINTHWHPEQTGANEIVGKAGGVILAHDKTAIYLANSVQSVCSRAV